MKTGTKPKRYVSVHMDVDDARWLNDHAFVTGRSRIEIMIQSLREYRERVEKKEQKNNLKED